MEVAGLQRATVKSLSAMSMPSPAVSLINLTKYFEAYDQGMFPTCVARLHILLPLSQKVIPVSAVR